MSLIFEYCLWGVTVLALVVIAYITSKRYGTSDKSVFNKAPNSAALILKKNIISMSFMILY